MCYPLALIFEAMTINLSFFSNLFFFAYCTGFGLLLVAFECNTKYLRGRMKDNFGFLFTFLGRSFFLLFLSSLCFVSDYGLGTIIAALTLVNACFNGFVMVSRREFRAGGELSVWRDPTQRYQSNSETARGFAENNPELARRAAAEAVEVAKENPNTARKVVSRFY